MRFQRCRKKCCFVKFCPLELAFATTIHKFQGREAGKSEDEMVNTLFIDVGEQKREIDNPGILYVGVSRGKTLGDAGRQNNRTSSLYFIGSNMSHNRVMNLGKKADGEDALYIKQREIWCNMLNIKNKMTNKKYKKNMKQMTKVYKRNKKKTFTREMLDTAITTQLEIIKYAKL